MGVVIERFMKANFPEPSRLEVTGLHAGYDRSQVLRGVSFTVAAGEIVSLLGRNGSGRSTTVKAVMGLIQAQGSVRWNGRELLGQPAFRVAQAGVGYVPENRDVFPRLTVEQNLILGEKRSEKRGEQPGAMGTQGDWRLDDMYRLFPRLRERRHTEAGVLSGGEQQMLTLCRTLMGCPALMLIDEPTEGLAPLIVVQVAEFLRELRRRGVAVLLVEQKLTLALDVADRCLVMGHGQIVFTGPPAGLRADAAVRREWLEV